MIILMFGPPGCGKGTQARMISDWLGIPSISTGDLLRATARSHTPLGRQLKESLARGEYASDDMVNQMVSQEIDARGREGIILDGYPRTVDQAIYLEGILQGWGIGPAFAIHIDVPAAVIVDRLSSRVQCVHCRAIYNLALQPPRVEGMCDGCGSGLVRRSDDEPDVILKRLETYHAKTSPVIEHFHRGRFLLVDGHRDPTVVFSEIQASIGSGTNGTNPGIR